MRYEINDVEIQKLKSSVISSSLKGLCSLAFHERFTGVANLGLDSWTDKNENFADC